MSKESFDAALVPGVRDRLAKSYQLLRQNEQDVFQSMLDESGEFREGIARVRDCPCCGMTSLNAPVLYTVHGMHVVQCGQCTLLFSREVINRGVDSERYRSSNVMDAHIALHTNETYSELEKAKAQYIIASLRKMLAQNTVSLLDIGCSTGSILQAAREVGWQALGIELNSAAVEIARAHRLDVVEGSFPEDLPESTSFHAVTLLDVLEHAENPVSLLASVARCLSPGGLVGVQVPNYNSLLIRIEGANNNNICHGHWSYFTPETLTNVANKAGLQALFVETFISEIDRIRGHPKYRVVETAQMLTGKRIDYDQVDHRWIHEHLLGYKLFGVFVNSSPRQEMEGLAPTRSIR